MARYPVSLPDAVWLATAMLHCEDGVYKRFSADRIHEKILDEKINTSTDYKYIRSAIGFYCVANYKPIQGKRHRKLYREGKKGKRTYKLYRRDYKKSHPDRANGSVEPDPDSLPQEYRRYVEWYRDKYCRVALAELEPAGTVCYIDLKNEKPPRLNEAVMRFVRDTKKVRCIKEMYNDECQVCGHLIQVTLLCVITMGQGKAALA